MSNIQNKNDIVLTDPISIRDEFSIYKDKAEKGCSLKGHVIFKDPLTGKVIAEKDNLILLRGRAYILELLFGLIAPASTGYINDKGRTVCLFKVGQGGTDIYSTPLEVISPRFGNEDMYSSVPFLIKDSNKDIDPSKKANPSFVKELTDEQKKMYYLPKDYPDNSTRYFAKTFEKDTMRLKINKATGETYVQLTLRISPQEARGFIINELGLVLARYDEETNTYLNPELFSHVTFSPYVLSSLKRGVLIEYLVYA